MYYSRSLIDLHSCGHFPTSLFSSIDLLQLLSSSFMKLFSLYLCFDMWPDIITLNSEKLSNEDRLI